MSQTSVALIGELAARELGRVDFEARVIGATSRAIYLESREGEVLWVAPEDSAPHRRAILAPLEGLRWRVGDRCGREGDGLVAAGGNRLVWRSIPVWSPPRVLGGDVGRPAARQAFGDALSAVSRRLGARGLAAFWTQDDGEARSGHQSARWLTPAHRAVVEVAEAGQVEDAGRLLRAADALVGLGEGLTPSGDDFLGGLLFVRWHRVRLCDAADPAGAAIDAWLEAIRVRTTAVSRAILADLAHGQGPGPLHELVVALAGGAPFGVVAQHAVDVARIGHSSGWDLLAGVAAGLGIAPTAAQAPSVGAEQRVRARHARDD